MKICTNCGASNDDSQLLCSECGMMLPESRSGGKSKGKTTLRIPQPVLLGILAVIAVGLIVGGIVLAIVNRHSDLEDAWGKTMLEFPGAEDDHTQFRRFFAISDELLKGGDYSTYAAFSGGKLDLQIRANYSLDDKLMRGDLSLGGFGLEFSAENKNMQIRFPGDYEVYGFNVDDINKILESLNEVLDMPLISNVIPVNLPTDLELDLFKKSDLTDLLESVAGEEYQAFKDSLKIEEWNDETVTIRGRSEECQVYKISWKSESASKLLGALGSGGFLPNVGSLVNAFLPEMDPYVYCYISDGYLVGARFTAAGTKCFLLLEGEENLWENFTLTAEQISGETKVYQGSTVRSGTNIELCLKDGSQTLLRVEYDDASGDFRVHTQSGGVLVSGRVTVNEQEAGILLNWNVPETGEQSLQWTIGALKQQPQPLGEHCSDLGDLSWSVLESLIVDFITNQ